MTKEAVIMQRVICEIGVAMLLCVVCIIAVNSSRTMWQCVYLWDLIDPPLDTFGDVPPPSHSINLLNCKAEIEIANLI